jgi:hypothetical protein
MPLLAIHHAYPSRPGTNREDNDNKNFNLSSHPKTTNQPTNLSHSTFDMPTLKAKENDLQTSHHYVSSLVVPFFLLRFYTRRQVGVLVQKASKQASYFPYHIHPSVHP